MRKYNIVLLSFIGLCCLSFYNNNAEKKQNPISYYKYPGDTIILKEVRLLDKELMQILDSLELVAKECEIDVPDHTFTRFIYFSRYDKVGVEISYQASNQYIRDYIWRDQFNKATESLALYYNKRLYIIHIYKNHIVVGENFELTGNGISIPIDPTEYYSMIKPRIYWQYYYKDSHLILERFNNCDSENLMKKKKYNWYKKSQKQK